MLTDIEKYVSDIDGYVRYLNDICNNDITFNYSDYNNILNGLKTIKINTKPNSGISLYVDYLFNFIKDSKINNKIRKIKLQKIMNNNDTKNIN